MIDKFNLKKHKVALQFSDSSVFFLRMIYHKKVFRFEKDFKALRKWEFHFFEYKQPKLFSKYIEKFSKKFMRLY